MRACGVAILALDYETVALVDLSKYGSKEFSINLS